MSKEHMKERKDNYYSVPEGYFKDLNARLMAIPSSARESGRRRLAFDRAVPYMSLVAFFALLVIVGTAVLQRSSRTLSTDEAEYFEYAYTMIPRTEPYSIYDSSLAESLSPEMTDEDVINYLIESGVSVNELEYAGLYY